MSDSEEFSSESAADFEESLRISGALANGTHLEELKWLKKSLDDELAIRKELDEEDFKIVLLRPTSDTVKAALDDPVIKRLLKHLRLDPPFGCDQFWKIPASLDEDDLEHNSNTVQIFICSQLNKCKSCNVQYKSILKHLKKSDKCMDNYSKEEFDELVQMAQFNKKKKETQYREKNKKAIASKKAKWYIEHKDQRVAKLEGNKADISKQKLKYERMHVYQISKRKAKFYIDNKEKIKAKRQERKIVSKHNQQSKELQKVVNDSTVEGSEYSFKRKPIDFSMADLEAATEEEDKEFKADVGDVGKKSQPSRNCKIMSD